MPNWAGQEQERGWGRSRAGQEQDQAGLEQGIAEAVHGRGKSRAGAE